MICLFVFYTDSKGSQKYLNFCTATHMKTTQQKKMLCNFQSDLVRNENNPIKRAQVAERYPNHSLTGLEKIPLIQPLKAID